MKRDILEKKLLKQVQKGIDLKKGGILGFIEDALTMLPPAALKTLAYEYLESKKGR